MAQPMTINRTVPWLLAGIVFFLGTASASGQYPVKQQNVFVDILPLHKFQPFAPVELSDFNLRTESRDGFFFSYQRAVWYITPPDVAPIGDPEAEDDDATADFTEVPDIDTSVFDNPSIWGNVFELGWRAGHHGLMARVLGGFNATQTFNRTFVPITFLDPTGLAGEKFIPEFNLITLTDGRGIEVTFAEDLNANGIFGANGIDTGLWVEQMGGDVNVVFTFFEFIEGLLDGIPDTPNPGLPDFPADGTDFGDATNLLYPLNSVIFDTLLVTNTTKFDGVELMYIVRPGWHAPRRWVEFYAGARYFELQDSFNLQGLSTQNAGFTNTTIKHRAVNRLIGPQVGLRLFHSRGRWTLNGEGRLMAAANFLTFRQQGVIGEDPFGLNMAFANKFNDERFSMLSEAQLSLDFRVTDAISLTFGYTGTFVGEIGRASNTVVYQIPDMGIAPRVENVMMHGVNFGFEVAR
ncbi:MAG: BBP7 family outer membrane beta-barrel protein [Planctomycetota bacterium]|nr:BBP7 family outer membrane beta-barrel protein [Planctomycetota bacterium]